MGSTTSVLQDGGTPKREPVIESGGLKAIGAGTELGNALTALVPNTGVLARLDPVGGLEC